MARSAPPSISFIDSRVLHDLQLGLEQSKIASDKVSQLEGAPDLEPAWAQSTVPPINRLNRAVSWGGSWGVVTVGRGFDWKQTLSPPESASDTASKNSDAEPEPRTPLSDEGVDDDWGLPPHVRRKLALAIGAALDSQDASVVTPVMQHSSLLNMNTVMASSPSTEIFPSMTPTNPSPSDRRTPPPRPPISRSCTSYSARRRSSAKRVSLIAGRVSVVSIEPPSPPPVEKKTSTGIPRLSRFGSTSSMISIQSAAPPSDDPYEPYLGGQRIDDFEVEEEIGRGAYGLVKRAREILPGGKLSAPLVIKQVIKSRILADCWKKHPKHGTIPIEIFVMSAISSSTYSLPPARPWDPARFGGETKWIEGNTVQGHPNVCPLLEFFEDHHYYYLILPYTSPDPLPGAAPDEAPAKDLFDLVEAYPQGLPPDLVRSYLGQLADAMCYLHNKGIVHRDIKDENVVLGAEPGKCILIDFGSSGVVRKHGWDTFSGTLDYASPEILRGERYSGKEQDVWAYGIVAYVLLVGECPFITPAEAQEGLVSPLSKASMALDERCGGLHIIEGEEVDGGGGLGDAAALVRECLQVEVSARPSFERILENRFLSGEGGWGMLSS